MSVIRNKQLYKDSGFTIVELLIVIVVIGILASITIVSFNGIQNRAKATAARSLANSVLKKAEIYNASNGQYPSLANFTAAAGTAGATAGTEAALPPNVNMISYGAAAGGALNATSGNNTIAYLVCVSGGTNVGIEITYWDYTRGVYSNTPTSVSYQGGQITGTCG
ncbi:MAG: prepilin-type N-terminal cleavage/methylation domain-containing protein [Alcaligenaceae bacterium]|nr:MAG: prepilin-type N-terminal cleavage/methylation domain-containing protein [Alcaligenaceae bacterium]